ncbi:hypothetical protein RG963_12510 [Methanosarcina sp. Z-7115]|uniref:Uncharacterized protein n=1 Tax=Methanosarcina baikalica TaxID=3073890 RepID=A0ABU2D3P6_9EURY|nr:hypothetical protein [Methanosarcina sp. Z-7115]MDR7666588.1 hypothetical protein [Methanosarcina sp. Z-7115]
MSTEPVKNAKGSHKNEQKDSKHASKTKPWLKEHRRPTVYLKTIG